MSHETYAGTFHGTRDQIVKTIGNDNKEQAYDYEEIEIERNSDLYIFNQ